MSTMSNQNSKIRSIVKETLKSLGVRSDILGYEYLKFILIDSINLKVSPHKNVTIITYPFIADHFDKTKYQVERSIRHSIENAKNENTDLFNMLFGSFSKVTNSLFLSTVYEYITEELMCDDTEE